MIGKETNNVLPPLDLKAINQESDLFQDCKNNILYSSFRNFLSRSFSFKKQKNRQSQSFNRHFKTIKLRKLSVYYLLALVRLLSSLPYNI